MASKAKSRSIIKLMKCFVYNRHENQTFFLNELELQIILRTGNTSYVLLHYPSITYLSRKYLF